MSPYIYLLMVFALGLGTTITFTSTHWLLAWMGLEINTMAIIPLMAQQHHPRAVEATTKYFLIQATAAATLLFASTINAWFTGQWEISQLTNPLPLTIITIALALKIGLAPVHSWLPDVMQGLNLNTGLILATWQKLAPFSILFQINNNPYLMIFLGLTSILMGGWGGLNQTQLRKLLAYSSIAHLGWMVLILQFFPSLTLITLIVYIIMTFSIFNILKMNKATNINSLSTSWVKNPITSALTPLVLLSLGGLPPLTGFLPKWMILQELTKQHLTLTATVAALSALISLYFYLRLSYALTLTTAPNTSTNILPWRFENQNMKMLTAISIIMTICMLPLLPTIMMI
uniref:NADH-ubiquinone oxidoreductase chain 2 n=1 Tax=Fundulopanchax gardneri TaxID=60262 RepID=Q9TD64_FUNGA|nr:NADH dehydrogenase subunit 2 [Fundulopanchax gardneri]AAF02910.1 NADH dehydrogenase subunit II [Fundulopanchax gardneri]QDU92157.1 NADH dehydrogenase subunit 2 [Fundulopanchax gardneri]